jgi:membrane associated rhomboid family serine protease
MQPMTKVVKNIIIINVLIFGASWIYPDIMYGLFAGWWFESDFFKPWQIITHMFMHGFRSIEHILFNMFALYMFGSALENHWGAKKFLTYYMLCGLGAFVIFTAVQYFSGSHGDYTVGASGAVFGLLLGFGYSFPETRLMLLFPPIPIKAKHFVMIYGAIELYMGIQNNIGDNVAHFAHLGGALVGFVIIKYWERQKDQNNLNHFR